MTASMTLVERVARALSVPQHHTTWDILSDADKHLFLTQAEYALKAIPSADAIETAEKALEEGCAAIKAARDRVPDEEEGLPAQLFAHHLNAADAIMTAALATLRDSR